MRTKVLLPVLLLLVACLVAAAVPDHRSPGNDGRVGTGVLASTYWIDTSDRAAVNHAWNTRWRPAFAVSPSWTGSVSGCRKGTISSGYLTRTARAINFVRALNRIDPASVVRDTGSSTYSTQAAALLMRANNQLSHYPPPSWRCWSRAAANGAARSLLGLTRQGSWTAGAVLAIYLTDAGSSNTAVAHRRWLTTPWAATYYLGATTSSNALMPRLVSSGRRNPPFTSWPTQGWFPTQLDPGGRWSWSSRDGRDDLSRAQVRVVKGGRQLAIQRHAVRNGYGQPTVAWQMPPESPRLGTYTVTVSGVRTASGTIRAATTYRVNLFRGWAE